MSDSAQPAPAPLPGPVRWIKENFEAVVVAFIMALVIRCFSLEVFKIPTASMEPTLLGDARDRSRGGDRIMVNKFAYEVRDVQRYDILVFKFPLDLSRNFIKRCVGLPDEELAFRGGDIYTRKKATDPFVLARKPLPVQENVWIPVYTGGCDAAAFRERWKEASKEKDNWELYQGALRTFASPGKSPETRFAFVPEDLVVYDVDRDRPGIRDNPHPVSDLRIGARVEFLPAPGDALAPRGEFDLTLRHDEGTPHERVFRVVLRPGAPVRVEHPAPDGTPALAELPHTVRLQTPVDVALLVYDGAMTVLLDGRPVHDAVWRTAPPPADAGLVAARLSFGTRHADTVIRNVSVARDLYYFVMNDDDPFPPDRPVRIPPDCHLLVGDNIRNSHDGRAWQRVEVEFIDGTSVFWDRNLFLGEPRGDDLARSAPDCALFLKKSDTNPHVNEVGWAVPHRLIRSIRKPRPRHQFTLAGGGVVVWDSDLVRPLPNGAFALHERDRATGGLGALRRTLAAGEVAGYGPVAPVTWVERKHIVGKAFAIWWPPGRWFRLIR